MYQQCHFLVQKHFEGAAMIYVILVVTAVVLAYSNGANDNFKATATVYGAGALGYRRALVLATIAQISGSIASVFWATALIKAFGGKGLLPDAVVASPVFLAAVGLAAACTVLAATRFGLPVSTTHALFGGLVGAGLAFAPGEVAWSAMGTRFFLPLLISPILALILTAALYPVASFARRCLGVEADTCVCIEDGAALLEGDGRGSLAMRQRSPALAVTAGEECVERYSGTVWGVSAQQLAETVHMGSAFSLGFARGLNDTPKVLGILVAAQWSGMDNRTALILVACAMAVGGLLHSRRLAETMGKGITPMNPGQGLLANGVSSVLVIGASLMGSPVSTTHVSTGAIVGIGTRTGHGNWALVSGIFVAWLAILPLAAFVAYAVSMGLGIFFS
jgi:PiT family inorganic phosphate transporter